MDKPKIRTLIAYPALVNDRRQIAMEDPLRISSRMFYGSPDLPVLLDSFDGQSTLEDISAIFLAKIGRQLEMAELKELVRQLDENLMLDNERFAQTRAKMLADWRAATVRPPAQAGLVYPKTAAEITAKFDGYLKEAKPEKIAVEKLAPSALLAPTVAPQSGAETYVSAYQQLRGHQEIELFVILCNAFHPMTHPYCGLRKDFLTPYGTAVTDKAFLEAISSKLPFPLHADEWAHRAEYGIEYQVLFLQWLFGGRLKAKIAPILVGNLIGDAKSQGARKAATSAFIGALQAEIKNRPGKVCVITAADLTHLGSRFGDTVPMNESRRKAIADRDRALLQTLGSCDPQKFIAAIMADKNGRRIGFGSIYTMLSALRPVRARLLRYGQYHEQNVNTVTSFGSAAFYA